MTVGSTQQVVFPSSYLCECADRYLACKAEQWVRYDRYKVGIKPDINLCLKIDRMRRIVCGGECGLCPDEMDKFKEELNKMLS